MNYRSLYDHSIKVVLNRYADPAAVPRAETTLYRTRGKVLVFVAGNHAYRANKKEWNGFLHFLDEVLEKTSPTRILAEYPMDLPLKELTTRPRSSFMGEVGYLAEYSLRNRIKISGMDAKRRDMIKICPDRNDIEIQKLRVFVEVLKTLAIPWYNLGPRLKGIDRYEVAVSRLVDRVARPDEQYGFMFAFLNRQKAKMSAESLVQATKAICKEVIDTYVEGMPIQKVVKNAYQLFTPAPFCKKYKINYLNALGSAYRNKCMIESSIEALKHSNRVVAVAGSGHIQVMREPLGKEIEAEFGLVEMYTWSNAASFGR